MGQYAYAWCHMVSLGIKELRVTIIRAHSRRVSSQWETSLLSNGFCHWLDTNLESAQIRILDHNDSVLTSQEIIQGGHLTPQLPDRDLELILSFLNKLRSFVRLEGANENDFLHSWHLQNKNKQITEGSRLVAKKWTKNSVQQHPGPENKWQPDNSACFCWGASCGQGYLVIWTFIGFNAIELLQSEKTFVLSKALWYRKHLSMSLIAVGDIIIWISLDKFVKTRDVKFTWSNDMIDDRPNSTAGLAQAKGMGIPQSYT